MYAIGAAVSVFTEEDFLKPPIPQLVEVFKEGGDKRRRLKPGRKPVLPSNTPITVRLSDEVISKLDSLIGKLGSTRSEVVRNIVESADALGT